MASPIFYFRLTLYTLILLTVSFWAILIGLVATILGKRLNTNYYVARTFWHVAGRALGWKFEVEGEEYLWDLKDVGGEGVEGQASKSGRSAVMVGNHQR
jgi:phosphatidylinositol glycan class A protein